MPISEARRAAVPALAALLAGCTSHADAPAVGGGARIACARGDAALADDCTVERTSGRDGPILILRAPDGGFRRLLITHDGRGVIAADGALPARVTIAGPGLIDVAIGGDRYRLPATIGAAR